MWIFFITASIDNVTALIHIAYRPQEYEDIFTLFFLPLQIAGIFRDNASRLTDMI